MLELVLLGWLPLFLEAVDPKGAWTPLKDTGQWGVCKGWERLREGSQLSLISSSVALCFLIPQYVSILKES